MKNTENGRNEGLTCWKITATGVVKQPRGRNEARVPLVFIRK